MKCYQIQNIKELSLTNFSNKSSKKIFFFNPYFSCSFPWAIKCGRKYMLTYIHYNDRQFRHRISVFFVSDHMFDGSASQYYFIFIYHLMGICQKKKRKNHLPSSAKMDAKSKLTVNSTTYEGLNLF